MKTDIHLPDLVGKTEDDPLVQRFIRELGLVDYDSTQKAQDDWAARHPGEESLAEFNQRTQGLLSCRSVYYILDPVHWIVDLHVESFRHEPCTVQHIIVRKGYPGRLPYGLQPDADLSSFAIGRLLDTDHLDIEGVTQHSKTFLLDDLSITLCYDEPHQHFAFLRMERIDPYILAKLRFHDGLKAQKKHVVDSIDAHLAMWQAEGPVLAWRRRMAEGDDVFTPLALELTEAELAAFIDHLRHAVAQKSPTQIVNALKKCIKNLNRLTRKHGHFIETTEREELVPHLWCMIAATGLQTEEGFDVTQEWREW